MLDNDISTPNPKSQQDYFLLGACITNTLLFLAFIWRLVPHLYKPTGHLFDLLPEARWWYAPEIDVPLYIISWIAILISFLAYYFINRYLSRRLDTEIIHLLSKGLLFLSLTTLVGVHGLYLIAALSGAMNSPNIDIGIMAFCYLAIATFIISSCLFRPFRNPKFFSRFINWSIAIFAGGVAFLLIINCLVAFSFGQFDTYLLSESQLQTTHFTPVQILLTILFILFFVGLLVFFEPKFRSRNGLVVSYLVDLCVVFAIAYAVFDIKGDLFNSSYFMGPINDILHGKTLMVDSTSQYGLLSIYGLALLFKSFGIHLTYGRKLCLT